MEYVYKNQFYLGKFQKYSDDLKLYTNSCQYMQNIRIGEDIDIVGTICEFTCEPGVQEDISRFFYESCWRDDCKAYSKFFHGNYRCLKCGNVTSSPKLRFKVDLLILSGSTIYKATSFESTKYILNHSEDHYLKYSNASDLVLNNFQLLSNKKFSFKLRHRSRGLIIQSCVALHNKWQN